MKELEEKFKELDGKLDAKFKILLENIDKKLEEKVDKKLDEPIKSLKDLTAIFVQNMEMLETTLNSFRHIFKSHDNYLTELIAIVNEKFGIKKTDNKERKTVEADIRFIKYMLIAIFILQFIILYRIAFH